MGCIDGCGTGEYKTVQYSDYTFDCQTIAEKLGKHPTSGPNNMGCIDGCGTGEYKTVQYGDYTFDCQTIAQKLGKHHTKAMAGHKQKWLRTTCNRFDIQMICGRIETKHKHIEDAEERNGTIKQEDEDFLEDYECIVFGH
jgi:hypothetical protein